MTPLPIDWQKLLAAVGYYGTIGYKMVEVPWTVPREFMMATCPAERWIVTSNIGDLIGSAEQGFIYLDHTGKLPKGKWMALTPCFRVEDNLSVDPPRQNYFVKLELYDNSGDDPFATLEKMIWNVENAHNGALHVENRVSGVYFPSLRREEVDGGTDLIFAGVEIGSFGIRSFEHVNWVFGTGMAEPRFSSTINRLANEANQKLRKISTP